MMKGKWPGHLAPPRGMVCMIRVLHAHTRPWNTPGLRLFCPASGGFGLEQKPACSSVSSEGVRTC